MDMGNNAFEFDEIAQSVFFSIYPVIAKQIIEECKITEGVCVDIGSGGGHLGLWVGKNTNLKVTLLDKNEDAIQIAEKRIAEWELKEQVVTKLGDVHNMPFEDGSVDMVISRGSLWFWDKEQSVREIYRVLKPGGMAYVGGGYGNAKLKQDIYQIMIEREGEEWLTRRKKCTQGNSPIDYSYLFDSIGISNYCLKDDESGTWFIIRKEEAA
jgi:ubiquinone/menaquinone biosynthesis C-methylase UbiE